MDKGSLEGREESNKILAIRKADWNEPTKERSEKEETAF